MAAPSPDLGHTDDALYHVWRLPDANKVAGYFVESTAPVNVEGPHRVPRPDELPDGARPIPDRAAARDLAGYLRGHPNPEIVFLVNGFNTPRPDSKEAVERAWGAINGDGALNARAGLVFVGYRWPSEALGTPYRTSVLSSSIALRLIIVAFVFLLAIAVGDFRDQFLALPGWVPDTFRDWLQPLQGAAFWALCEFVLLTGLAATLLLMSRVLWFPAWITAPVVYGLWVALCWSVANGLRGEAPERFPQALSACWLAVLLVTFMVPAGLFTLRIVVYFRDAYRAATFGIPDLAEFIRDLDEALAEHERNQPPSATPRHRVRISFVGHSMGAFVVTNLIRVLADAFPTGGHATMPAAPNSQRAGQELTHLRSPLSAHLCLGRLVLISPDISTVPLLSHRSNSLAAALQRCEEAYLFSSEGDGVLRTASTLANYFSFPTGRRAHGYRLGNLEVLGQRRSYGIVNRGQDLTVEQFLGHLRVGHQTMADLHRAINPTIDLAREQHDESFPSLLTYFDCTAYRDERVGRPAGRPVGLLTWGIDKETLGLVDHTALLVQYLFCPRGWKIDIHGGYFEGKFSQELIYRLAGLGFARTIDTYGGTLVGLSDRCAKMQIRVLLSPEHQAQRPAAAVSEPMLATR